MPRAMQNGHSSNGRTKLIAVLPEGGDAAENERYVCCVENALGLRELLGDDVELVITSDKEGENSELEKNLADANIIVTTPFHPAYLTKERLDKAQKLQLVVNAGIGCDHVDLQAAADKGIIVTEVQGSNNQSVAEDEVLRILLLLRNFLPAHQQSRDGKWDVPAVAATSYDLVGKTVGTVGGGRIGWELMKRLNGWEVNRLYFGHSKKEQMDKEGIEFSDNLDDFLGRCDIVSINVPLTDKTKGMFDASTIGKMKKGSYLINNARGAIVDRQAVVDACTSGQLAGYSGDVWDQQPAPPDHPWRTMPHNAMTPHTSGTTLDAQERYQQGVQEMLKAWFKDEPFKEDYYVVKDGKPV